MFAAEFDIPTVYALQALILYFYHRYLKCAQEIIFYHKTRQRTLLL